MSYLQLSTRPSSATGLANQQFKQCCVIYVFCPIGLSGCGRGSRGLRPDRFERLAAFKINPQSKLSALHCTAWYLRLGLQLAMEQPSAQLAKAGPGVPLVAGKRSEALRQTTLPVPCSQPALPIVGAKRSSDLMDKKTKQAWYWD
eukprot:366256-Chlamydomonas_euryale.AAC.14